MLLRFRVANVRSFRDEQELVLVAPDGAEPAWTREVQLAAGENLNVYPVIGVFGANASGKSNLLTALFEMRQAVLRSYADWASRSDVPREVFSLDPQAVGRTSFFELDFVHDGVRYAYGFELGTERVEGEWLHAYPRGHRQIWFDRAVGRIKEFEFPGGRLKDRSQLVRLTRPDALFLSVAGASNHPQLGPIFEWFRRNLLWVSPDKNLHVREAFTRDELQGPKRERIQELLRVADLGIRGVEVINATEPGKEEVRLWHGGAGGDAYPVKWEDESFGTRSWFALLGPMLIALDEGRALLVDELDASLHPRFAAEIIRLFQDPDVNKRGSQLIFTSHDVTILGGQAEMRLLDPGQVWLVEKDKAGASELFPLADAEPRAGEDLALSYLAGRFGAVPALAEGQIGRWLRALRATEGAA
ncbi:AAA family ATPase [Micromonospora thermarum]|uniref:ATP-binding protein n=1 Tax=Micromonospora thermarum TaxID=2720024 RepID=A0ABX0ZC41_9ACTN|nr:ATP-binding protein [Micromonospora thermarum]NJP33525.1 ATP-binding protein [Micromonospora thermarum]